MRTKTQNTRHLLLCKQQLCNINKAYIESDTEQAENTRSSERQKTSFPKESVENADFYILALSKIMTTQN